MATKAASPAVGHVYNDRDHRRKGRRVKVTKVIRAERKAVCENVKTGRQHRISFDVLASRFTRAAR